MLERRAHRAQVDGGAADDDVDELVLLVLELKRLRPLAARVGEARLDVGAADGRLAAGLLESGARRLGRELGGHEHEIGADLQHEALAHLLGELLVCCQR